MDNPHLRALHGPGLIEIVLGVSLSLLAGVALAAAWLVIKPVETVKEPSEEALPSVVYFVPGETSAASGRTWMRKRQVLLEGQTGDLAIFEQELNAWASATLKPPAADATETVVPGQINFRIRDSLLQIGAPSTLNIFGMSFPVVIQARGTFGPSTGNGPVFTAKELYFGSLAVHRVPGLTATVMSNLSRVQSFPDDVVAGWKKLASASVDGEVVTLKLP